MLMHGRLLPPLARSTGRCRSTASYTSRAAHIDGHECPSAAETASEMRDRKPNSNIAVNRARMKTAAATL